LIAAVPALGSPSQVISDCNANGHLTGSYSRRDLQSALSGMGADTKEYTNCYDVIRSALLSSATSGGRSPGGGSGAGSGRAGSSHGATVSIRGAHPAKPAPSGSNRAVSLAGSRIQPGSVGAGSSSTLPTPLIGVLILLGLVALGGGGVAIRRRVFTGHSG
jgi:hypothetical protein